MAISRVIAATRQGLSRQEITKCLETSFASIASHNKILVIIPDHTRSLPLPFLFKTLAHILGDASKLDFLVALGTHPPLNQDALFRLVGLQPQEYASTYRHIHLFNHAWDNPSGLVSIGIFQDDEIRQYAGKTWDSSLPTSVNIQLNKLILDYEQIIILGPTFPHEVAGFSGGAKYLFPGISGGEMINATHWMGALSGVVATIGIEHTPVRAMIHAAAGKFPLPVTLAAFVMENEEPVGIFIGDLVDAWSQSVGLSQKHNIIWKEKPYLQVLSCAPAMYDELWTAAKAMYKLEPVVAKGGELIIYAPHLDKVSLVHGDFINRVGYHVLPYFLQNWEKYKHIPLGVLAHSTHLRGGGEMEAGIEKPNIRVTLASRIPPEECARLNLGYQDPATINPEDWKNREDDGILFVPRAGEMLYRLV